VGRQEELNRLMQCLDRAGRGRGSMVLLEGEPGVGRSSLVRELSKRASARGVEAAWGRAWEAQGTPAFWPWTAVVRALVQRQGLERVRALSGDYAHALAPVAPELTPKATVTTQGADLDNVQARFRLFGAMSRLMRAVSLESDTALLLILEDVHCADAASLQLLRYMSEEVADMPVLIVATLDELAPLVADSLTNSLPWTAAHLHRIRLRGLSRPDASTLVDAKLGAPAPARLAQSLYELSAGNPLLLHGLCSRLRPEALNASTFAAWDLASHPLPERIVASVRGHLTDLPSKTLHVLGAASIFGREFRVPWLAALLEMSEAELLEALALRPACPRRRAPRKSQPRRARFVACHRAQLSLGRSRPGARQSDRVCASCG